MARRRGGLFGELIRAGAVAGMATRGGRQLMAPQKPRKTSKGKTSTKKLAVTGMPKNRIGGNSGLITSNQKVPLPKKGSVMYRRSVFGVVESAKKLWVGGSTTGQQQTHFRAIAHAMLVYYMRKCGDIRGSNDIDPTTSAIVDFERWYSYKLQYAKKAQPTSTTAEFFAGATLMNKSLTDMAIDLGAQLEDQANRGRYPQGITLRHSDGTLIFSSQNVGKDSITVKITGRFRFNNTTPAGDGDVANSNNINDINANPISGKIYTFRNQSPIYQETFKDAAPAGEATGIKQLNTVYPSFEVYGLGAGGKGGNAFIGIDAPPLNPRATWKNVSSTGNVAFPPGGFKTYTTSYLRKGTIQQYIVDISQRVLQDDGTVSTAPEYPPAGDSFMMCLRPMIKTSGTENVKVAYDVEHIITAMIHPYKVSALPAVNAIE